MSDERDGILNPEDSEPFTAEPAVEAVKRWQDDPTADMWAAARDALAPQGQQDEVEAAMLKVVLANDKTQPAALAASLAALYGLVSSRQPIATTTWADLGPAPPREWLVKNWLPTGCVAILSGRGGFGKSRLTLQLAAGVASGGESEGRQPNVWIEGPVGKENPMPLGTPAASVLYVSWEDDGREFSRRLAAISGTRRPHGWHLTVWPISTLQTWQGAGPRGGQP